MEVTETYSLQTKGLVYILLFSLFILSVGATGIIIPETEPEQMTLVIAEELEPDHEFDNESLNIPMEYDGMYQFKAYCKLNAPFSETSSLILKRHSDIFTPPPDLFVG